MFYMCVDQHYSIWFCIYVNSLLQPMFEAVYVKAPVTGEFPAQRPVMRSFDVTFDLRLNKLLIQQ